MTANFKITGHKGFHIKFDNNVVVSVQFGGGNYCDNYDDIGIGSAEETSGNLDCANAEVAIFKSGSREWLTAKIIPKAEGQDVVGHITPNELVTILAVAADLKPETE